MKITFLGATETVTGSKYLVTSDRATILVDCGVYQGYKWLRERNWNGLPLDVDRIDAIVLTHAHLDHSGHIPVLYQQGFRRPVFTHHATCALTRILLEDSGHIQEEDAKYYRRHRLGKHETPQPLYDRQTALDSMKLFQGVDYGEGIDIGDIHVTLHPVGHILGAASLAVEAEGKRVIFSGDVGRPDDCLMQPPERLDAADQLVLESTYGNRRHDRGDVAMQLAQIIESTARRGGALLVPSFAVGRAQALMHLIAELKASNRILDLPVYLDSPMAANVSDIYCRYRQFHRLTDPQCHAMCNAATFTRSVDESKALADIRFPHIIIAGSGMATGGRILHHFKRLIGDHRTSVLFTGYQADGTRGAKLLDGARNITIHGESYPVRATLHTLHGLSGHADFVEMGGWLKRSDIHTDTRIHLVHGSPDALEGQRTHLQSLGFKDLHVAEYQASVAVGSHSRNKRRERATVGLSTEERP